MNWRRSEFISISTLLVVASWIWYASGKSTNWDIAASDISQIKPKVESDERQLSVIVARLEDMQDDLKWIRRHSNQ